MNFGFIKGKDERPLCKTKEAQDHFLRLYLKSQTEMVQVSKRREKIRKILLQEWEFKNIEFELNELPDLVDKLYTDIWGSYEVTRRDLEEMYPMRSEKF